MSSLYICSKRLQAVTTLLKQSQLIIQAFYLYIKVRLEHLSLSFPRNPLQVSLFWETDTVWVFALGLDLWYFWPVYLTFSCGAIWKLVQPFLLSLLVCLTNPLILFIPSVRGWGPHNPFGETCFPFIGLAGVHSGVVTIHKHMAIFKLNTEAIIGEGLTLNFTFLVVSMSSRNQSCCMALLYLIPLTAHVHLQLKEGSIYLLMRALKSLCRQKAKY